MSNQSAVVLMLLVGAAIGLASCGSDDEVMDGVGGAEAGASGRTAVGGNGTSGRGGGSVAGGAGGVVATTASSGGTTVGLAGAGGATGTTATGGVATGGVATGGVATAGGATTGGVAGASGSGTSTIGGTSATAGSSGAGGIAGSAGMAGVAGTTGVDPLVAKCTKVCADQTTVTDVQSGNCSLGDGCMPACIDPAEDVDLSAVYLALLECEATNLSSSDYFCSDGHPVAPTKGPSPKATSSCAVQICAFTCSEYNLFFADENLYADCGC